MKKLKFPDFKEPFPPPEVLSMDDYVEFVKFHRKYLYNERIYNKWKKELQVGERFQLK